MCQSDAGIIGPLYFRDPGFIYDAIVTNLKPNSKYYYIFGSENNWSDEQWFVTGSDPNDIESQGTFKFAMYGDQGITSNSKVTLSRCYGEINSDVPLELLLHIGDLGYAEGRGWVWERWGNMISQVAMHVPYMISIGNHEYDHTYKPMSKSGNDVSGVSGTGYHPSWGNMGDDSYGECGAPSFYRFSAPNNGNSIFWYSFNYRSVHFILLSSEHDYSNGSNGAKWLLNDLENVNKTVTPWIILSIHRPLYVSQDYPSDLVVATHLIDELEPMLYKYNVDLVLTGHFHSYQRTCFVYNSKCVGQKGGGIMHIMIGTAGIDCEEMPFYDESWSQNWYSGDYGYGRFVVNRTTLVYDYVLNNDASVFEQVVINK
eukprot:442465_1